MPRKLKVLDLFCGAGGATRGLQMAGFQVHGVDINPQPRYCGEGFTRQDVMDINPGYIRTVFDFAWASPPCQGYSHLTPASNRGDWPLLIAHVRTLLVEAGVPFVIENVAGARKHLIKPIMLCGSMFKLMCFRHRFFECVGFDIDQPQHPAHNYRPLLVTTASKASRAIRKPGEYKSVKNAPLAYGIEWMDFNGLKEAIPPAYSEFIGQQAIKVLRG